VLQLVNSQGSSSKLQDGWPLTIDYKVITSWLSTPFGSLLLKLKQWTLKVEVQAVKLSGSHKSQEGHEDLSSLCAL
jgi:hypothetical protein